jgi:nitrite reductase (NO-forming)
MNKKKDILLIIPFLLIVIFGVALTYFSFSESFKKITAVTVDNISRRADDLPPQINRDYSKRVSVDIEAVSVVAEFDNGKTYEYWTFNKQVPGPFVRVREGDIVDITLTHLRQIFIDQNKTSSHSHSPGDIERIRSIKTEGAEELDRFEYSIDLQAMFGSDGVELISVGLGETKLFEFEAARPGLYIYNSGGDDASAHIARGMYGMMLVEPKEGLSRVDREYYVMEGEIYTDKDIEDSGFHKLNEEKLLAKNPDYSIFNGRVNALKDEGALRVDAGDTVRIFFGNSGQNASNFHIIGGIFDRVYANGDMASEPLKNVQTALVPAGGAIVVEVVAGVPGKLLLVDSIIDGGSVVELVVE